MVPILISLTATIRSRRSRSNDTGIPEIFVAVAGGLTGLGFSGVNERGFEMTMIHGKVKRAAHSALGVLMTFTLLVDLRPAAAVPITLNGTFTEALGPALGRAYEITNNTGEDIFFVSSTIAKDGGGDLRWTPTVRQPEPCLKV